MQRYNSVRATLERNDRHLEPTTILNQRHIARVEVAILGKREHVGDDADLRGEHELPGSRSGEYVIPVAPLRFPLFVPPVGLLVRHFEHERGPAPVLRHIVVAHVNAHPLLDRRDLLVAPERLQVRARALVDEPARARVVNGRDSEVPPLAVARRRPLLLHALDLVPV